MASSISFALGRIALIQYGRRIKKYPDMEMVNNGMKDIFGYLTKLWAWWITFIQGIMINKKKSTLLSDEVHAV